MDIAVIVGESFIVKNRISILVFAAELGINALDSDEGRVDNFACNGSHCDEELAVYVPTLHTHKQFYTLLLNFSTFK
jgi:hypothetical protein